MMRSWASSNRDRDRVGLIECAKYSQPMPRTKPETSVPRADAPQPALELRVGHERPPGVVRDRRHVAVGLDERIDVTVHLGRARRVVEGRGDALLRMHEEDVRDRVFGQPQSDRGHEHELLDARRRVVVPVTSA